MTAQTLTLTDFLLARIAEDEAVAESALHLSNGGRWWVDGPAENSGKHWIYDVGEKFGDRPVADHIARHDPARVLAECDAKRRIVERHRSSQDTRAVGQQRDGRWTPYCEHDSESWPCPDALALALPYADHPDYREEWRP